jgi:hypothetical protein
MLIWVENAEFSGRVLGGQLGEITVGREPTSINSRGTILTVFCEWHPWNCAFTALHPLVVAPW